MFLVRSVFRSIDEVFGQKAAREQLKFCCKRMQSKGEDSPIRRGIPGSSQVRHNQCENFCCKFRADAANGKPPPNRRLWRLTGAAACGAS